ncbi:MAG: hypothetical protein GXP62_00280 [Oligoflexia bacterium]|nr:hypothetical protein [Oligoflexia bacterium]
MSHSESSHLPAPTHPLRALVLCPGRGSYQRDQLGSLQGLASPALDVFEDERDAAGRPSVRSLDAEPRFSPRLHVAGEHASALTAAISLADLDQLDPARISVVAACGNSMGWYTALGVAGALPIADCAELVDTMGWWQSRQEYGLIGGQLVYPMVDADWHADPKLRAAVDDAVDAIPDLYWSIRLGGQAVLGGTEDALAAAKARLPVQQQAGLDFPLRLPLHSAFHTPLMSATAQRAQHELSWLGWRAPNIPLFDGTGRHWRPRWADPAALRDYTLGTQITTTFDFSTMLRTALGAIAPDVVILPGPGSNLGGAVAQVMIDCDWQGLSSKADFIARQTSAHPVLLSLGRPDQRKLAVLSPP